MKSNEVVDLIQMLIGSAAIIAVMGVHLQNISLGDAISLTVVVSVGVVLFITGIADYFLYR